MSVKEIKKTKKNSPTSVSVTIIYARHPAVMSICFLISSFIEYQTLLPLLLYSWYCCDYTEVRTGHRKSAAPVTVPTDDFYSNVLQTLFGVGWTIHTV